MASRYSVTIQLADASISDKSPGHAAVVINTPEGQTYAGLGPVHHDWRHLGGLVSPPSFVPQTVGTGALPPNASRRENYSTVSGHESYRTFTIPISESQAADALAEIKRMEASGEWYDMLYAGNYCTPAVNRILSAAGLGDDLLYKIPNRARDYISDIEKTLSLNPKAKFMIDGAGRPVRIPESLRGIQRDYAYPGGGYDTPSERTNRVPAPREYTAVPNPHVRGDRLGFGLRPSDSAAAFGERFGSWGSVPAESFGENRSSSPVGIPQTSQAETSPEVDTNRRLLTRRIADQPRASVFDTGAPPVPFVSTNDFLSPDTDVSVGERFGDRASPAYSHGSASDPFSPDTPGGLAGRLAALAGIDPRQSRSAGADAARERIL